ncbi:Protein Rf1, mitochondrial [Seiridium cupressi]
MRLPYVCRPCLARLRQSSSQIPRHNYAAIHTVVAPEQDINPEWHVHEEPSYHFNQEQSRHSATAGDGAGAFPGGEVARRQIKKQNRTNTAERTPHPTHPQRLRSWILHPHHDIKKSWRRIAAVYGLPKPTAQDAAGQLERLLSDQQSEAPDLYAEYEAWKFEYGKILRHLSNASAHWTSTSTDWAVFADGTVPSAAAMRASWIEVDKEKREKLWPRMIQSMFTASPELLSSFLQATYDPSWSPFYVAEDVVRLLLLRSKTSEAGGHEDLLDLVFFLLKSDTSGRLQLSQDVIGTIISNSSLVRVHDLFHHLRAADKALKPQTSLHFASRFAKSNEHKALAAEILCGLARHQDFDINSPAASSVCTSLLHLSDDGEVPQGPAAPDELFRLLLEAGLRPNILNITALMRNFCIRGHLDTAWTVFELLLGYGIEPDEHVYSTLLHAAKQELDVESIRRIMAAIHTHNTWSAPILNDFLDIILRESESQPERRRRQKKTNNAFRHMLLVYAKFFRLEPLQKLCTFPLEDYLVWQGPPSEKSTTITQIAAALLPQPESKLVKPDTVTLSLMLSAAIRGAPRFYNSLQSGVKEMLEQINHFNRLFDSGDSTAVALVDKHGSLMYDVFLRGMLQFQQCLHPAVHLVQTMLGRHSDEQGGHGRKIPYPRPSVHTWTMLVNGFKNHRQPGIAASMVRMMIREGGVKPNMVTWNTLITAFACVHDAQGAVRTIKYLETSGLRPDKYTIQAIRSMNSRARKQALALMEASMDKLIPPDDDVVPLLAAPGPVGADYPDPVLQQLEDENAPPLSDEEVWTEMRRLTAEGDDLLSQDIESLSQDIESSSQNIDSFDEDDFPEAQNMPTESAGAFGANHPRNTNQLVRLLEYKKDVDAFIARLRANKEGEMSSGSLIESNQPIAKPIMPPTQISYIQRLKSIWDEAYEARDQLRDLNHEERPLGLRPWEETLQGRLQARAENFKSQPVNIEKGLNGSVPIGIVARQNRPSHPRLAASRQLNPKLRRQLSRETNPDRTQEDIQNTTHT